MKSRVVLLVLFLGLLTQELRCQDFAADSVRRRLASAKSDRERLTIYLTSSQLIFNSDPLLALEYAQQAGQLAQKLDNDSLLANAQHIQANSLLNVGNYSQALDLYLSMVKYGERKSDSVILAGAYGNIGNVYYYQNDFDKGLENYFLSLQYFSTVDTNPVSLTRKANLLNNIGTILDQTKKYSEAKKYYTQAMAIGVALQNQEVIATVLNNQGTLYRDEGNEELALKYYREAYGVRTRNNNVLGMARSCFSLGLYFLNHRVLDSASIYLNKSIELGKQCGSLQTVSSAATALYKVSKELGDDSRALRAFELSRAMEDSLYNEQTTKRIAQLEMRFLFDKEQREIQSAQRQKELYYLLGASALLLVALVATVLFLLQKNKTRKAQLKETQLVLEKVKLKNDLDKKDKELATNITFLLSKNELINHLSEKLLNIKHAVPAESQTALQKVILDLQSNLQPELWHEFEFRFQQVYEHFYKVLTVRYPDLTPSERRLCAFLRLNVTTKEISALTHQNAKSIDVARTRLRKKLGLTGTDQNLVTFLEQLDGEG